MNSPDVPVPVTGPDLTDPDLAVDAEEFEVFAELVVAAVLSDTAGAAAAADVDFDGAVDTTPGGGDVGGAEATDYVGQGTAIAGEGGDALYTLPDGTMSFSGSGPGGLGDVDYSFDIG
jgi:hypothetical protein